MSEQTLRAGERRQMESGDILALSPLPVETGAEASDPIRWIGRKNNSCMDLQGGNWLFSAELSLMFVSLIGNPLEKQRFSKVEFSVSLTQGDSA